MSTFTAHTLLSRPVRHSAGGSSLRCPKPAVVSLPYYTPAGKKTPRSICHYVDPRSIDHPSNIPSAALVNPVPTTTAQWKIKEEDEKVELTFFAMGERATPSDFQVAITGEVLEIKKQPVDKNDDVSFHVRLLVPEVYNKDKITVMLYSRNLDVSIPKVPKSQLKPDGSGKPFYRVLNVEKK
ncbi:hypothetical protein EJB05_32234 [Eragrostis curvula]|uniref:SHSP domain-containing protein n=1 Tax=Eragrostis curvula TaxID=38414 RepID=A0A5J9UGT5_9POAL|nr:hypothetical protein EJB05_32234 [Eragrostis curvula]